MKKLIQTIAIIGIMVLSNFKINAQVNLEHTYYFYHRTFWVTDIGNNDFKYVIEDSTGFSIYNLDHSPYILNIVPPVLIFQPPSYYEIAYLTKSLFDCDSTNIEYVITAPTYSGNFYIYRTDGTLLFERDTVKGPYYIGQAAGSVWTQPIFNTPTGAKLLLFSSQPQGDPDSISVYSLCGIVPTQIRDIDLNENFVKVFPNPTNGLVNFEITPPNNQEQFKITIYNSSFKRVEVANISGKNYQLDINKHFLSSGTYLFDLRTENKIYQTGKFIISK